MRDVSRAMAVGVASLVLAGCIDGPTATAPRSTEPTIASPPERVAALIVGKYGPLPPGQLEARLRASADDLGKPGNDDFYGAGRVNAGRAVQ